MKTIACLLLATTCAGLVLAQEAHAGGGRFRLRAQNYSWHAPYYHTAYGAPVALVVPPTAKYTTDWGWGVGNTRMSRIDHQFARPWPGPFGGGGPIYPMPHWPSDTNQFGVYNVRGPW